MVTAALPKADYTDRFETPSSGSHTAEQWARAAFEGSSRGGSDTKQLVWRRVLQLRLGPLGVPDRVAGWQIVENAGGRLVLAAESWHLTARLVFEAEPDGASVTTRVTYRHLAGRAVWMVVGPIHRHAVPDILSAAQRRLEHPAAG
jgi:hypothetical protein